MKTNRGRKEIATELHTALPHPWSVQLVEISAPIRLEQWSVFLTSLVSLCVIESTTQNI